MNSPKRLDALDGWRAIGALLVIASHLQIGGVVNESLLGAIAYGRLGVDYFFGISGFVIARGLLAEGEHPSLGGFYVRRFFRIIPPLALYVAVVVALSVAGVVEPKASGALRALTFTCNFHDADCGGWLGAHTWSLSVEEQFYLVIPVVILVLGGRDYRGLLAVTMALVGAAAFALLFFRQTDAATFLSSFTFIALGVTCALCEPLVSRFAERTPGWLVPVAFAASVGIIYLPPSKIATLLSYLALAPIVLFALMVSAFRPGWLQTVLGRGPLKWIGGFSYGLYLWQQLATGRWPGDSLLQHVVAVIAAGTLAWALYRWMERPLNDLGRRLAGPVGGGIDGAFRKLGGVLNVDRDDHKGYHGICHVCERERWDLDADGYCQTCYGRTAP